MSAISVVIPVLNEAGQLRKSIELLRTQGAAEIIVVDGGSSDATHQDAQAADLVLHSARGRALQMNTGAARAKGEILLFLHADTRLADGWQPVVARTLRECRVVAGCFEMRIAAASPWYRLIERAAAVRVRATGISYGDQGLFLHRELFSKLGGFPAVPFLEDLLFSRQLRQLGRLVVAPHALQVSPRRWQKQGIVKQTLRNWSLLTLAACGVPPARLAQLYPAVR